MNTFEKGKILSFPDASPLGHEWAVLQDNHEQYEKASLLIKLGVIALFVACVALSMDVFVMLLLMLVMWLQEAILRTSQSRLGERILQVEQHIAGGAQGPAYQLHSEWCASRPGLAGLLAEYAKNALRPTVAFPYVVLVAITVAWYLLG